MVPESLERLGEDTPSSFLDPGLLAAITGITHERIARDRAVFGSLLETFVFSEVLKQSGWLDDRYAISHYRDKDQDEVDLVVENEAAELVGIEVKASATVETADFKGLRKLAGAAGQALRLGVVLYDGTYTVPFGDRLFAAPVSCVWA